MTTTRERIIELAHACLGQGGPQPWAKEAGANYAPHDRPEWCGLFVRAIWRRAGLVIPDWVIGEGNTAYLRTMRPGELIQPGDMGYVAKNGHQAIVVHDDGRTIRSIDGNGPGERVVERLRPRSDYAAFYSIDRLVASDAPTQPAPRVPTVLSVSPVQGPHVEQWQRALMAAGHSLRVDGVCGPKTTQALVEFAIKRLGGT